MIIYNNIIPFKGFIALTFYPFIFVRNEYKNKINDVIINHENIHKEQQKELLLIFFYIIYCLEYIINLFLYKTSNEAYRNISFEKEAYKNENNLNYKHKWFAQWRKQKGEN